MPRRSLENRRASETIEFDHQLDRGAPSFRYRATFSRFADGAPAEVFLSAAKVGADTDVNARDAAIVASLALQHGCPVDLIRAAVTRNADGSPAGVLGRSLDKISGGGPP